MPRIGKISLNCGELVLLAVMLAIIVYAVIQIALQVIHMFTTPPPSPTTVIMPVPISLIAP